MSDSEAEWTFGEMEVFLVCGTGGRDRLLVVSVTSAFVSGRLKRASLGAFKKGQFDKQVIGDFHGKYFVTFFGDASMANRLAMDKTHGIMQLFAAGMSGRQIARTLNID